MALYFYSLLAGAASLAGAQDQLPDTPNPIIQLSTCKDVQCNPSNESVCSAEGLPGAPIGVGIAPKVINLQSTNATLTLIDGLDERGFTASGLPAYEFTDLQLFVGLDSNLDDNDFPEGCALMMQYQGQTFPVPDDRQNDEARSTSCEGVIDELCQAKIHDIVQSFSNSSSEEEGQTNSTSSDNRCTQLSQYVNRRLRENVGMCGGHWISSLMNVTGGPLPSSNSDTASAQALGEESCRPVLPQEYQMYPVADMRQYYFKDPPQSDFLEPLFGGRAGYTPVVTVLQGGNNESMSEVQFTCMRTFYSDGETQAEPFQGAGNSIKSGSMFLGIAALATLSFVMV